MSSAAIILAAGASRRMGSAKPLLDWGGQPLILSEIETLEAAGVDDIVIVLGASAQHVRARLGRQAHRTVFNAQWPQGRSTSLVTAARTLLARSRPADAVVIQNVDQPTRVEVLTRLLDELGDGDAVQPEFDGHGAHPVVVAGRLLPELATVEEETLGLRGVLEAHPPRRIAIEDPIVSVDLDTPEDLEQARAQLAAAEASRE